MKEKRFYERDNFYDEPGYRFFAYFTVAVIVSVVLLSALVNFGWL